MLKRRGIKHELLNALPEHAAREAEIVAQAGRIGAVTISTNMAGRGTDIILGGNPETLAWAQLKDKYASRLDVPEDEWKQLVDEHRGQGEDEGRGPQGRRDGRPAHRRHRTARRPPHRQPAARPGRPSGRSRLQPVLSVARRRPDAHLRRRVGVEPCWPGWAWRKARRSRAGMVVAAHRGGPEEGRGTQLRQPQAPARVRRGDGPSAQGGVRLPAGDPRRRRTASCSS